MQSLQVTETLQAHRLFLEQRIAAAMELLVEAQNSQQAQVSQTLEALRQATGVIASIPQSAATTSGSHGSDKRNVPIVEFHGRDNEDPTKYIFLFESLLDSRGVPENEYILFIKPCLRGRALTWLHAIATEKGFQCQELTDYKSFKAAFLSNFRLPNFQTTLRTKLCYLRQNGTLQEYISRFRDITSELKDMSKTDVVYHFLRGLRDNIKRDVAKENPTSLERCIELSLHYDSTAAGFYDNKPHFGERRFRNRNRHWRNRQNAKPSFNFNHFNIPSPNVIGGNNEHVPMDLGYTQGRSHAQKTSPNTKYGQDRQPMKCYRCGKPGHMARNCKTPNAYGNNAAIRNRDGYPPNDQSPRQGNGPQANRLGSYDSSTSLDPTFEECPTSKGTLPTGPVSIRNSTFTAILDTGASRNTIARRICDSLHLQINPEITSLSTLTGKSHYIGTTTVPIAIGPCRYVIKMYVVDNPSVDILLGDPFWKDTRVSAYWKGSKRIYTAFYKTRRHILPFGTTDTLNTSNFLSYAQFRKLTRKKDPTSLFATSLQQVFPDAERTQQSKEESDKHTLLTHDNDRENEEYQKQLADLIHEYQDIFQEKLKGLPPERAVKHKIELKPDAQPRNARMYTLSPKEMTVLREQLSELLEKGLVAPSDSEWCSPILFVKKKNGDLRLCVDFRYLNSQTIRDNYGLPLIEEVWQQMAGSEVFSSIDLTMGYWNIAMEEQSAKLTTFTCSMGTYYFKVLPFGLCNAPSTFMRAMHSALKPHVNKFLYIYLDDILVFSKNKQDHLVHLRKTFEALRKGKYYVNMKKCDFMKPEIDYVGHRITRQGIKPQISKIQVIQDWPRPTNQKEVKSFHGMVSYYRRYVKNFARIALPLTDLMNERTFQWNELQEKAFKELKQKITTAPVLRAYDPQFKTQIECDASGNAVGLVLHQYHDKKKHPVAFYSRKLSGNERTMPVWEKEVFAIVTALRVWRHYVEGKQVTIKTDHEWLKNIMSLIHPSRKQAKWIAALQASDLIIEYKPGQENRVADALSRHPVISGTSTEDKCVGTGDSENAEMIYYLSAENDIEESVPYLARGEWPELVKKILNGEELSEETDLELYDKVQEETKNFTIDEKGTLCRLIDEEAIPYNGHAVRLINTLRAHKSLGHVGHKAVAEYMRKRVWWPDMEDDIKSMVASCHECQLMTKGTKYDEPLNPNTALPPFHRWGLDFIGELPETKSGYKWIVVATDYGTRWTATRALKNASGYEVSKFLYEEIVCKFGCPHEISTDRGSAFLGYVLKSYLRTLRTKHLITTAFNPRANGLVERHNGILGGMLAKFCRGAKHNWDTFLHQSTFAMNIRKHRILGCSPFYMLYGVEPLLPGDDTRPIIFDENNLDDQRLRRELEFDKLRQTREYVIKRTNDEAEYAKSRHDKSIKKHEFNIGDLVYRRNNEAMKFEPKWEGPFIIQQIFPFGLYQIGSTDGKPRLASIHGSHLKPAKQIEQFQKPFYKPNTFRPEWFQRKQDLNNRGRQFRSGGRDVGTQVTQTDLDAESGPASQHAKTITVMLPRTTRVNTNIGTRRQGHGSDRAHA